MNPTVLSFDTGIINLAFCLFTKENNLLKIIDWGVIDLIDRNEVKCCCGKKALLIQNKLFFCKVCSRKCEIIKLFDELYKPIEKNVDICSSCTKKCTIIDNDNNKYCLPHAKALYKIKEKELKITKHKNKNVNSLDFDETRLKLFQVLEDRKNLMETDFVLIENQPSFKNPTMKSIANGLYDFYLIRGILDKSKNNSNISKVKFIAPCNKLKLITEEETQKLIIAKSTNESISYKLTKQLGIKYCSDMIAHLPEWVTFFNNQKKKDDLADALLQGVYYYEKFLNKV